MSKRLKIDTFYIKCHNDQMVKVNPSVDEQRRKDILDAALYCFLHFGFSKTSMDDVAKKAGLSRPLIYLKFKNKDDLLMNLFDHIMDGRCEQCEEQLGTSLSQKELLMTVCEILILEPWSKISGFPMSQEFFGSCSMCEPKSLEKWKKNKLKIYTKVLGDKAVAEVFDLCCDGLHHEDLPTANVLRKRLEILVDKFTS